MPRAHVRHMDDIVDEERELSDAFAGDAVDRLGAELHRRLPGGQDQQATAGLIRLDQYLARRSVELARTRGETLEGVVGERGEHLDSPELRNPVSVDHHRYI